jgi:hypothetical protein
MFVSALSSNTLSNTSRPLQVYTKQHPRWGGDDGCSLSFIGSSEPSVQYP